MEWYSMLYGVREDNTLLPLGASTGLTQFLKKNGAIDPNSTAQTVQSILRAFKEQSQYKSYLPIANRPVAIRYAPMHFNAIKSMPSSLKPFCAIGISGTELAERDPFFTKTIFFPYDELVKLHRTDDLNYLDYLFGFRRPTAEDLKWARMKMQNRQLDRAPEKIVPDLKDLNSVETRCIVQAVEALYMGKNVVIRLSSTADFNTRANELLSRIYSLVPPMYAREIGYATYQDLSWIPDLLAKTSIRVFVLPAETDLSRIAKEQTVFFDLDGSIPEVSHNDLADTIVKWMKYPWAVRRPLFESAFAKTNTTYNDASVFVQISNDCFTEVEAFERWQHDPSIIGSVNDLTTLKQVYEQRIANSLLPWAEEQFNKLLPTLLAEGKTVSSLLDESLFTAYFSVSPAEKSSAASLYRFAARFGHIDEKIVRQVAAQQLGLDEQKAQAEMSQLKLHHDAAIKQIAEQHQAEVASLNARFSKTLAEKDVVIAQKDSVIVTKEEEKATALTRQKDELQKAHNSIITQMSQAHSSEIQQYQARETELVQKNDRLKADHAKAVEQLQQMHDQDVQQLRAQHNTVVGQLRENHSQQVARLTAEHSKTVEQLKQTHSTQVTQLQESVERAVQDKESFRAQLTRAERDLKDAESAKVKAEVETKRLKDMIESHGGTVPKANEYFSRKMVLIMTAIGFVVGALLLGLIWGGVALFSRGGNETPPETATTVSAEPSETTLPTETEPVTVPPESESATEPPEPEFDPKFVFDDWASEDSLIQLQLAIETIHDVQNTELERFVPNELMSVAHPLVAFTVDDALPTELVQIEELTNGDAETDLEIKSENDPVFTAPSFQDGSYAVLFQTDVPVERIEEIHNADLVIQNGDKLMLVKGDIDLMRVALKVFNLAVPASDVVDNLDLLPIDTGDANNSSEGTEGASAGVEAFPGAGTMTAVVLFMEGKAVNLTSFGLPSDMDWWRSVSRWTDSSSEMFSYRAKLNTNPLPIMAIDSEGLSVVLFRYDPEDNRADALVELKNEEPNTAVAIDNYVVICVRPEME